MNKETFNALSKAIHYLYEDEKKDWEALDRPSNHIFEDVLKLQCFLQEQGSVCKEHGFIPKDEIDPCDIPF